MGRNVNKILIAVLVVMVLWFPTVQAEETKTLLRWKNGGSLPGQLQESSSGTIHWASPYFLDDLVVENRLLLYQRVNSWSLPLNPTYGSFNLYFQTHV
ncbi:MAG: hypothetical protein OXI63_08245 [Candidatus Poribacteria bacterium]|nr:hypothetical protein [Candidatus Poribacteria bacterium]